MSKLKKNTALRPLTLSFEALCLLVFFFPIVCDKEDAVIYFRNNHRKYLLNDPLCSANFLIPR